MAHTTNRCVLIVQLRMYVRGQNINWRLNTNQRTADSWLLAKLLINSVQSCVKLHVYYKMFNNDETDNGRITFAVMEKIKVYSTNWQKHATQRHKLQTKWLNEQWYVIKYEIKRRNSPDDTAQVNSLKENVQLNTSTNFQRIGNIYSRQTENIF